MTRADQIDAAVAAWRLGGARQELLAALYGLLVPGEVLACPSCDGRRVLVCPLCGNDGLLHRCRGELSVKRGEALAPLYVGTDHL